MPNEQYNNVKGEHSICYHSGGRYGSLGMKGMESIQVQDVARFKHRLAGAGCPSRAIVGNWMVFFGRYGYQWHSLGDVWRGVGDPR